MSLRPAAVVQYSDAEGHEECMPTAEDVLWMHRYFWAGRQVEHHPRRGAALRD